MQIPAHIGMPHKRREISLDAHAAINLQSNVRWENSTLCLGEWGCGLTAGGTRLAAKIQMSPVSPWDLFDSSQDYLETFIHRLKESMGCRSAVTG